MHMIYRKFMEQDLDALVSLRLSQLREEGAQQSLDLAPALYDFYRRHLQDASFVVWLALDQEKIVATSGMSFTEKPPYYQNPTGKIGLLSNVYTLQAYRRQGIAKALLAQAMAEAKTRGCGAVIVSASSMGTLLYTDFGFVKSENSLQFFIQ